MTHPIDARSTLGMQYMFERSLSDIPYCGLPPLPQELWSNWNLDPLLIALLAGGAAAYHSLTRKVPSPASAAATGTARAFFYTGWTLLGLALVSPLCSLSVALFSARVAQHMLISLIAAPLIALGLPRTWRLPALGAGSVSASFAAFLWLWHAPVPYAATFNSDAVYWAMHVTLLVSAVMLWRVLLDVSRAGWGARLLAGFVTLIQMSVLGALITFAPRLLYTPHVLTTQVWGFTPIEDQQLGGLIMWVPGCSVVLLATLAAVAYMLSSPPMGESIDPVARKVK